ncbi:hypothetical protein OA500_00710 [Gammaproteobacteria bacterium]|jgi:hypothetical protein|nr:hypothetical protein [Gammaproteobacteria bacterium]|tara:strand:- start:83 stop:295 length:213 start_codon:yes stop_codon:yes gene_type:complete
MMENAKRIVSDLTGIGVALIALGVVLGVVIGTDVAFVPNVLENLLGAVAMLGESGLVGIIVLLIVMELLR